MNQLSINIISGLVVAIIIAGLGIGSTTKVSVSGIQTRKTGKWMIIISVAMIFIGLAWLGKNAPSGRGFNFSDPSTIYGFTLVGWGVLLLVVGKIVTWFQTP